MADKERQKQRFVRRYLTIRCVSRCVCVCVRVRACMRVSRKRGRKGEKAIVKREQLLLCPQRTCVRTAVCNARCLVRIDKAAYFLTQDGTKHSSSPEWDKHKTV